MTEGNAGALAYAGASAGSAPVDWWRLLKPRVMSLVLFSAITGLYLAPGGLHPVLLVTAILCVAAAAGAAAAINNAYDADIDRRMLRTCARPTAAGRIAPAEALACGIVLTVVSVMVMGLALNWTAASLLAATVAFYVLVYTLWLKRRTPQNIVIGGAAGAFPPLVGWAAVTGGVDPLPLALFAIVFFWTPPHFWALALYRRDDYARAGVPMLPVVAGLDRTRQHVLAYTALLLPLSLTPLLFGAGALYAVAALGLGLRFVQLAWRLRQDRSEATARRTFRFSLLYLAGLFGGLMLDKALGFGGWL